MTMRERYDHWRNVTYPRYAPGLVAVSLLIAIGASLGVLWLTRVQGEEQTRRAADIAQVLECFDEYTTAQSEQGVETRVFTAAVTAAQVRVADLQEADSVSNRRINVASRERGRALGDFAEYALTTPPEEQDPTVSAKLVSDLLRTQATLIKVEDDANPVKRQLPDAYRQLREANEGLKNYRDEHPVTPPPSTFCDVQP